MRGLLLALVTAVTAVILSSWLWAQDFKVEKQQLKGRQKAEQKALKVSQKYTKESLKGRDIPKSMRDQMKHQRHREARELREKHKDERQDLRDRERLLKETRSRH